MSRFLAASGALACVAVMTVGLAAASGVGFARAQPLSKAPAQGPDAQAVQLRAEQVSLLLDVLADAESHGFGPQEFTAPVAAELLQSQDPRERALGQAQLAEAVLRYAKAVHVGRLPLEDFRNEWGLRPAPYDPQPEFARAVAGDQLKAWIEGLPPPYTGYQTLRQGLANYREIAARGGWRPISPGPDLKVGDSGPRVLELRARLAAEDIAVAPVGPPVFDDALAAAVARAQKRFGLQDSGVANASTLAALNTPVQERIDQIVANMERWRWLPQVLPTDRIQVNIAAAVLTVFHEDTPTLSMRAVTGRPGDETPMLQSQIQSLVFNPPWNVPSGIAAKELWPKERAHPGYLRAHGFTVIPTGDTGSRLQQKAGPTSALGRIKFDFPNPYAVYLHDTPSQGTFGRYSRLASHGCVRLQKPLVLAKALFAGDPTWTPEAIEATIASGKTVRAPLSQPIAVLLFYWTAYVGPDGQVNFRGDPYGWDRELIQRLSASGAARA